MKFDQPLLALLTLMFSFVSLSTTGASPESIQNTCQPAASLKEGKANPSQFTFGGPHHDEFYLNGKPFQIRGAEIHPQRVPKKYWRHRIQCAKAMGLNTIAFYVFWNDIQQSDGSFDFKTGNRDIAGFLKLCQEEGMWVLFRPGPYVCGEWDLGGLPHYLLKSKSGRLRSLSNPTFMKAQTAYLDAISAIAKPYLCQNGGPILMTQIENEYGSYGWKEKNYVEWLYSYWKKKGFGPFYTSDGAGDQFLNMALPGVAIGLDPGISENDWNCARKNSPNVPVFSSETYPGWLRHWGEGNWKPTIETVDHVRWYMETGKSFNLFVFHGGTNFGFTAGANGHDHFKGDNTAKTQIQEGQFQPDITSYDYGSPIGENGLRNECYNQMRNIITQALPKEAPVPEPPKDIPTMELPEFTPEFYSSLWESSLLGKAKITNSKEAPHFEAFNQNQGIAVYQIMIPAGKEDTLTFEAVHDYAQIYLNGSRIGTLNRLKGEKSITIPKRDKPSKLEILVDTFGHINYHVCMEFDRKGIYGLIKLGDKELKGWSVRPMPLLANNFDNLNKRNTPKDPCRKTNTSRSGGHFRISLDITSPKDTFLDMSKWKKGYVFVNKHNLGRYWEIGPQTRLYCPKEFFHKGKNIIDIIELELSDAQPIRGAKTRNMDDNGVETKTLNNAW